MIRKPFKNFLFLLFLLPAVCVLSGESGYHFRFDDWANPAVRYLMLLDEESPFLLSERPFDRGWVTRLLSAEPKGSGGGLEAYYRRRVSDETAFGFAGSTVKDGGFELNCVNAVGFSQHVNPTEDVRLVSDIIGYTSLHERLSVYFDFQFDTDGGWDSDYHSLREWKNVTGDMRAAYFQYTSNNWSVLVGREFVHWGPGSTGSLLTSGHAPALDMIRFTADIWKFRFHAFNAILGRATDEEQAERVNRYFSGHRLSLRLKRLELALHETVVYGGPDETLHPGYLNPLLPYYFTDVMFNQEKMRSNVCLSLEAAVYWPKTFRWYGQFLVDEYYYEGEAMPNRTGLLLGFDWARAFGSDRLWLNGEYVRVSRWVYNYDLATPWNRLDYYHSLLGHPIGPDADLWHVEQTAYLGRQCLLRLGLDYWRHGETRIDTPLVDEEEMGNHHPPFPFGVEEKSMSIQAALEFTPTVDWHILGMVRYTHMENVANIQDETQDEVAFHVSVTYRFRRFWGR